MASVHSVFEVFFWYEPCQKCLVQQYYTHITMSILSLFDDEAGKQTQLLSVEVVVGRPTSGPCTKASHSQHTLSLIHI